MKKQLFFILFVTLTVTMSSQTTFTVNTTDDLPDNNINDAICADANGNCTLRAAIQNANKTSNKDSIEFDLSGTAPFTIAITTSELPTIGYPVIIGGRTQSEYAISNSPVIELDGSGLPINNSGLKIYGFSDTSEIYGLSIGGFQRLDVSPFSGGYGIDVLSDNTIIQSNYIGLKPDGTTLNPNQWGVYFYNSGNNTIGGTDEHEENVISGNYSGGVTFDGLQASNNIVQGNLLGTDATGLLPRGNRYNLQLLNAPNNTIGGNTPEAGNILSGGVNSQTADIDGTGISVTGANSTNNTIIGNYIGTDITGTQPMPNARGGILLLFGASNNSIGGDETGEGNLISGNGYYGIYLQGGVGSTPVASNSFKGNYIGVDVTGNVALPNGRGIMMLAGDIDGNIIGGTTPNSKNVISGNSSTGIAIFSGMNNQIIGNYIGTNASGTTALTNSTGIDLRSGNNSVGGIAAGSRNVVSGNYIGIEISGVTSSGCSIKGNYIGLNAAGNAALANTTGISIIASANTSIIGGPNASDRNIISGNAIRGVWITGASHTIQNNYIGLNPAGTEVIKNGIEGIRFNGVLTNTQVSENTISGNGTVSTTAINVNFKSANNVQFFNNMVGTLPDGIIGVENIGNGVFLSNSSNNSIGGVSVMDGNIIGNHNLNAIAISGPSSNNTIRYNNIGVGLDGVTNVGNSIIGIAIQGANTGNTIIQNRIANNDRGVVLQANGGTPTQVTISENSMYNNSVLGIDLVGTTENDADDADAGVNNFQNTPEISMVNRLAGTAMEITYSVPSSIANSAYPLTIEFFGASSGQGKIFIDSDVYTAVGTKTVTINLPTGFDPSDFVNIVATATDANGNTSEFGIGTDVTLSISQNEITGLKVYPNPVSNQLFIKSPTSENYTLKVMNALGQLVFSEKNHEYSIALDVSNLSKGLYFLNITSGVGNIQTIKFIKN
ncbi:T9SS type A sorting domain-containing protein [Formosa sp. PL04]|uniref:T9SS type A sorting domain-containing protein n=1 Tax=Formosa sp. PL04 TaxID=3081755 RepID=UPI002981B22D|nr:T9SS type A sorting domain-containing protein [Formosa sp. PL04]MDW5290227.1 T9SS type A sorting domain-containing protein [Formosa sp. PL04]